MSYSLESVEPFDWSDTKEAFVIFVRCSGCGKRSLHLIQKRIFSGNFRDAEFPKGVDIDGGILHSIPSSFHVIDERIPKVMRELIAEAEGSLKSNFLTGASACLRKVVYELALKEGAEGETYDSRVKSLKDRLPGVDPSYFDTLLTIQQVTSDKVHEDSFDGWQSKHLQVILPTLLEILREVYVLPRLREERRKAILELKEEVLGRKSKELGSATEEDEQVGAYVVGDNQAAET